MTENLSATDAYARECTARVLETDGAAVALDRTVVYPGGGGQPADHAWLDTPDGNRWSISALRRDGATLWHELAHPEAGMPAVGDEVTVELDWDRRHRLMRTHSALHVLCGVVWRDHGALVTGGNMEPLSGRMDFEFETMSGELVGEIEARVNEEIAADREIRVSFLPREEAFAIPDLIRTKVNLLPPGIETVRVIEIVGLDLQADGGTHVAHTGEIGRVAVTGYESKGRINKRIRIAVSDA
ncbi:MAG TPA: alanyl-tRNA editing protein [Candidatus Limnocylindria bacterium]|nr:alanyl-tRNA editing protein [Candidatus Limnocylindria bacterium]